MVRFERKVARCSPNILYLLSAKANNTTDLICCYRFNGAIQSCPPLASRKDQSRFACSAGCARRARLFEIAVKEVSARCYIDTTSSAQQRTHPAPQY